jgi:hypothetical protein
MTAMDWSVVLPTVCMWVGFGVILLCGVLAIVGLAWLVFASLDNVLQRAFGLAEIARIVAEQRSAEAERARRPGTPLKRPSRHPKRGVLRPPVPVLKPSGERTQTMWRLTAEEINSLNAGAAGDAEESNNDFETRSIDLRLPTLYRV